MDWELLQYLTESIDKVGGEIHLLEKPAPTSKDVYKTYGQVLFEQSCQKDEDYDFVKVRLELVALSDGYGCIFIRTEVCLIEGEAVVEHTHLQDGYLCNRFGEVQKAVEAYERLKSFWNTHNRLDKENKLGDFVEVEK